MKTCNLCHYPVVKLYGSPFGERCIRCGSTYIHRAMGWVLEEMGFAGAIRAYELSSRGALVKYLKRRFHHLTCSEFYDDVEPGNFKNGIQCQDVQQLTYENESFDLVTSTEVFEHVPDDVQGFKEIHRVLKRGGNFIFTVPLADAETTVCRARRVGQQIVHLLPPEYHGDRIRGRGRVLAYRTYGRDIEHKLASVGFKPRLITIQNARHAITKASVICCSK